MSDIPATKAPKRDTLAAYVHDAYELEKKIYAMEELEKELKGEQKEYEEKEFSYIPTEAPQLHPLKEEVKPMPIITKEEENNKIAGMKTCAKWDVVVDFFWNFDFDWVGCIWDIGLPLAGVLFSAVVELWFIFPAIVALAIGVLALCLIITIISVVVYLLFGIPINLVVGICDSMTRKRNLSKDIDAYQQEVQHKNAQAATHNENLQLTNQRIAQENEAIMQQNQARLEQFEAQKAQAIVVYEAKCNAYQAQIDTVITTIAQLKETRRKMYALDVLAPDYCELKHLHYIDHYFTNKLVDTIREAVILYRQEAFQEMVSMTLSNILSNISALTGEVRQLGMTLQKIHTEVANISQEAFQIRLLHEDMLAATESAAEETRAQRYATDALRESNERLEWYERQRYYGYL